MQLNHHSPIPLYRQLADRIRGDIDSGVHAISTKIPSENEMALRYGIGRPTVRQATDLLVRQGKLERRRGSGTFVLPPTHPIDLFSLAGTSAALRKSELNATLELAREPFREMAQTDSAQGYSGATPPETELADTSFSTAEFLRVERIATVDSLPVLYETLWLSIELFPDIQNHDLANQSLSALVRDVYFLEPTSADQTFFVVNADKSQAHQLQTPAGTPLLRVQRQLHFNENKSAIHAEIICLTDRFEFSQTLFPAHTHQNDGA